MMSEEKSKARLRAAYTEASTMLRLGKAASAERHLRAILAFAPRDVRTLALLGVALLDQDKTTAAVQLLEQLVLAEPKFTDARVDLARAYRRAAQPARARVAVRAVLEADPHHHRAWLAYGDILVELEQYADALVAFERARLTDPQRMKIEAATAALVADERRKPEELFREVLREDPAHVAALCGLAALALSADRPVETERLLRHALRQSAHLPLAYRGLAPALVRLGRLEEAQAAARYLEKIEPESPQTWVAIAGVATRMMRQDEALQAYERAALLKPDDAGLRISAGHLQKTLGRRAESEASYKAALKADPGRAEAWWSLADLKNYVFSDAELAQMQRLLSSDATQRSNRAQLQFALGKAFEQRAAYAQAFQHYAEGNALRRLDERFDIELFERRCERIRAFFSTRFFETHRGRNPSTAPIFIVGLPRSGSTLLEQILASHSQVDGTMELPNILSMVAQFDDLTTSRDGYPDTVGRASSAQLTALGERYLQETAPLRSGRAHFTDKLPNNFSHVGLIMAILPRATVIDARRHPMDACFSTFKQHFAEGQTFSYDLSDLGRYYRCYLSLMDHWDTVLPGRVLRVQYEELVREPEANIRRLLTHCGLAFEPACLNFHATRRAVRTASAEQVRQPLYRTGIGHWRHFEHELEPLRRALGDALERFEDQIE
jgi:tetratricopeptide (TPR) repeat protein